MKSLRTITCLLAAVLLGNTTASAAKPLKIYILAGQSNMEGHAHVRVIDYLGEDPISAPLLKAMKNSDGSYRKTPNTYISYLTGENGRLNTPNREVVGQLEIGFGNQGGRNYDEPGEKIGPELAFGITMQQELDQPILIIKTAWGGQSLHTDYRSPSSGPYVPSADDIERGRFDTAEKQQELEAKTGLRYRQMIEHVEHVLGDIKRVVPGYDPAQGYELAGFVWFQGFNDMVGRNVYPSLPADSDKNQYAKYSEWMANFIRDVRKDLKAPKLPFVIGVLGVGGPLETTEERYRKQRGQFRAAMAAPALMPEFKGNVFAVETAPFWDMKLDAIDKKRDKLRQKSYLLRTKNKDHENADGKMSPEDQRNFLKEYEKTLFTQEDLDLETRAKSNAGYHYLGSAKTYSLIGQAFAEALLP
ncbi:MAG: sialate O-acetylesterase [Planctomycetaceae bacterium]|jgi:hypothetical protein|nr:sialate O-acetylesterase [bacterium]MDB4679561.1 sialate O-acetylesterase [Planctomycetaceae bacterium]MDG2390579.1 sialate O-acetylesterase [Planctomycetaceae bacterium]